MVFLIIWIVCGFIGAKIGERSGQTALSGFLLGFLLGPIGLLILCHLGRSQPPELHDLSKILAQTPLPPLPPPPEYPPVQVHGHKPDAPQVRPLLKDFELPADHLPPLPFDEPRGTKRRPALPLPPPPPERPKVRRGRAWS